MITQFANEVARGWNGLESDDMNDDLVVTAIDPATIIAIISAIIPLIQDCRNRNKKLDRWSSRPRSRRFLLRKIEQQYHHCCHERKEPCNDDDCQSFAAATLDCFIAKSHPQRDALVGGAILTTGEQTILEHAEYTR